MRVLARALGSALVGLGPMLIGLSALAWVCIYAIQRTLQETVCGSVLRLWAGPGADISTYGTGAAAWSVLTLAMMAPALSQPLNHVWDSLPRRGRPGGLLAFMGAYLLVWLAAGACLAALAGWLSYRIAPDSLTLGVGAVFLAWQLSPAKQLCLNRCHHVMPLAPFGPRAVVDQVVFGVFIACSCVGSCWAVTFLMLVGSGEHWFLMPAGFALIFLERQFPPRPTRFAAFLRP